MFFEEVDTHQGGNHDEMKSSKNADFKNQLSF